MYEVISREEYREILTQTVVDLKQQLKNGVDLSANYKMGIIDGLLMIDEYSSVDDSIIYYKLHCIGDADCSTPTLPIRSTKEEFYNEILLDEQLIEEINDLVWGTPILMPYTQSNSKVNESRPQQNKLEFMLPHN
ncbi:hypothetical protein GQ473_06665 [archaeon]|nr:hypothetical protein [archaeon]